MLPYFIFIPNQIDAAAKGLLFPLGVDRLVSIAYVISSTEHILTFGRHCVILVFGALNMDMVMRVPEMPRAGNTVVCPGYDFIPGGKGANQAAAAALYGQNVHMFGCLGKDDFAKRLKLSLEDAGVVRSARRGRETVYALHRRKLEEAQRWLSVIVPCSMGLARPLWMYSTCTKRTGPMAFSAISCLA